MQSVLYFRLKCRFGLYGAWTYRSVNAETYSGSTRTKEDNHDNIINRTDEQLHRLNKVIKILYMNNIKIYIQYDGNFAVIMILI